MMKHASKCGEGCGPNGEGQTSSGEVDTLSEAPVENYENTVAGEQLWPSDDGQLTMPREIGSSIYVVGGMGLDQGHKKQLSSVERYDHAQRRWVETYSVRTRRLGAAMAFIPDFGFFVCGGFDGVHHLKSVECLNNKAANKTWTTVKADMPIARTFAGAVRLHYRFPLLRFADFTSLISVYCTESCMW